jgi:hypothetical protein
MPQHSANLLAPPASTDVQGTSGKEGATMSTGIGRLAAAGVSAFAAVALTGCVFVASDSADSIQHQATVGKELRDLKVARDEGAIEPAQYDAAKQKLLARLDKPCK